MFEDISPGKSREEIENENEEMRELIREARDTIVDLREENRIMDRKYNEIYTDARRFAKVIKDNLTDEQREKAFKELEEQEKLLERWNIMDPD